MVATTGLATAPQLNWSNTMIMNAVLDIEDGTITGEQYYVIKVRVASRAMPDGETITLRMSEYDYSRLNKGSGAPSVLLNIVGRLRP